MAAACINPTQFSAIVNRTVHFQQIQTKLNIIKAMNVLYETNKAIVTDSTFHCI